MIGRSLLVAGLFAALGTGILLRPAATSIRVDEPWLEKTYPSSLGNFTMVQSPDGVSGHSYKMDPATYASLRAYGIVGRVLNDGKSTYDVVVLAGDEPDTFHNPLACFQAQEWEVFEKRPIQLQTKSRGLVNAYLARARKGGQEYTAIYTFEGPDGTYASNDDLHSDLFISQLRSGQPRAATFFRFMGQTAPDEVQQFAARYLDASPVRPIENRLKN